MNSRNFQKVKYANKMKNWITTTSILVTVVWLAPQVLGSPVAAPPPLPAKQQDGFYFDPAPVSQDVIEGEEVTLRCDVSNRKMIVFHWMLNQKVMSNTSRRFQEDSDLRVLRADRLQDAGSFRCVATNVSTGMALRSTEAKLNVLCKRAVTYL